jgi:hypothetical protein
MSTRKLDPLDPRFPNLSLFDQGAEAAQRDREAKGLPPTVTVRPASGTSAGAGPSDPAVSQEATDAA